MNGLIRFEIISFSTIKIYVYFRFKVIMKSINKLYLIQILSSSFYHLNLPFRIIHIYLIRRIRVFCNLFISI